MFDDQAVLPEELDLLALERPRQHIVSELVLLFKQLFVKTRPDGDVGPEDLGDGCSKYKF